MNNLALKVFDNEQFGSVRTITKDDQPWFIGMDVARALGYKNPRDAVNKKVWKQNKDICNLYVQGQKQADEFVSILDTKSDRGNPKYDNQAVMDDVNGIRNLISADFQPIRVVHGGEHKTILKNNR